MLIEFLLEDSEELLFVELLEQIFVLFSEAGFRLVFKSRLAKSSLISFASGIFKVMFLFEVLLFSAIFLKIN